jgi:murein L,D-transpeptidase YafK
MRLLAAVACLFLGACSTISMTERNPLRSKVPQSSSLIASSERAGANKDSAVLLRIFKEERQLELWRQSTDGTYGQVAVFEICSVSGGLGPKIRQGDRQAPEGFYEIHPRQMNPHSAEWLSFNTGYPNQFDKAHRRTGSALMVHGGCSSAGCYAIQDGPMQDLYAAMRDAFAAGQSSVQLQIYPFKMDSINLLLHDDPAHQQFWKQLKVGYDRFEQTHRPFSVQVKAGRYHID